MVLAVGHSARDVYRRLAAREVLLTPKPFALGFRIEHPQVGGAGAPRSFLLGALQSGSFKILYMIILHYKNLSSTEPTGLMGLMGIYFLQFLQ